MLCDGLSPLITGFGFRELRRLRSIEGIQQAQQLLGLPPTQRFPASNSTLAHAFLYPNASHSPIQSDSQDSTDGKQEHERESEKSGPRPPDGPPPGHNARVRERRKSLLNREAQDVYALGFVLFELGGGTMPKHTSPETETCPLIPQAFPRPFADLIRQCWSADPKERPALDALGTVAKAMNRAAASLEGISEVMETDTKTVTSPKSKKLIGPNPILRPPRISPANTEKREQASSPSVTNGSGPDIDLSAPSMSFSADNERQFDANEITTLIEENMPNAKNDSRHGEELRFAIRQAQRMGHVDRPEVQSAISALQNIHAVLIPLATAVRMRSVDQLSMHLAAAQAYGIQWELVSRAQRLLAALTSCNVKGYVEFQKHFPYEKLTTHAQAARLNVLEYFDQDDTLAHHTQAAFLDSSGNDAVELYYWLCIRVFPVIRAEGSEQLKKLGEAARQLCKTTIDMVPNLRKTSGVDEVLLMSKKDLRENTANARYLSSQSADVDGTGMPLPMDDLGEKQLSSERDKTHVYINPAQINAEKEKMARESADDHRPHEALAGLRSLECDVLILPFLRRQVFPVFRDEICTKLRSIDPDQPNSKFSRVAREQINMLQDEWGNEFERLQGQRASRITLHDVELLCTMISQFRASELFFRQRDVAMKSDRAVDIERLEAELTRSAFSGDVEFARTGVVWTTWQRRFLAIGRRYSEMSRLIGFTLATTKEEYDEPNTDAKCSGKFVPFSEVLFVGAAPNSGDRAFEIRFQGAHALFRTASSDLRDEWVAKLNAFLDYHKLLRAPQAA